MASEQHGAAERPGRRGRRGVQRRRLALWDRLWVRRWHRLRGPAWLDRALVLFVRLGDGWGWLGITLLLAMLLPRDRFLFLAGQGLFAAGVSLPLYWILKSSFRRHRPYALFKGIIPRISPRDLYSFPSGHTMNNLAIGVSLAFHLPVLWPFALALPILTGLLRVVFGVHFISDIAAGTVFGLLAGVAAALLWQALSG
jgi:undecaprenyl-diphosphatase